MKSESWRAIGFDRGAVIGTVLAESVLLGLVGGVAGGLLTWVALNGYQVSTLSFESFTQIVFAFTVTPDLLLEGILLALLMGFIGGLPSALSAARAPSLHHYGHANGGRTRLKMGRGGIVVN